MALIPHLANGSGPSTILIIHGAASAPAEFVPLLPHLPYHLLIPSYHHIPFTLDAVVQPIIQLIEAKAKNGRAHVVGHSIGAHIALALADQHPDLVDTLFLSGYNRRDSDGVSKTTLYGAVATEYIGSHVSPFVRSKLVDIPPEVTRIEHEAQKQWPAEVLTLTKARAYLAAMTKPTPLQRVDRILVIAATKGTWLAPTADSIDAAKRFKERARVIQHRAMRHQWTLQDPELFAGTMVAWIEERALPPGFEEIQG